PLNCFRADQCSRGGSKEMEFSPLLPIQCPPVHVVVLFGNAHGSDCIASVQLRESGEAKILSTCELRSTSGFVHKMEWATTSHQNTNFSRYIAVASTRDSVVGLVELRSVSEIRLAYSFDASEMHFKASMAHPFSVHQHGGRTYIGGLGELESANPFSCDGPAQAFAVLRPFKYEPGLMPKSVIRRENRMEKALSKDSSTASSATDDDCDSQMTSSESSCLDEDDQKEFFQAGPKKYTQRYNRSDFLGPRSPIRVVKNLPDLDPKDGDRLTFNIVGGFAYSAWGGEFAIHQTGQFLLATEFGHPSVLTEEIPRERMDRFFETRRMYSGKERRFHLQLWEMLEKEPSPCTTAKLTHHSAITAIKFCNTDFNKNIAYALCSTTGELLRVNVYDALPTSLKYSVEYDLQQHKRKCEPEDVVGFDRPVFPTDIVIAPDDSFAFIALYNAQKIIGMKKDEAKIPHRLKYWACAKVGTNHSVDERRSSSPYAGRMRGGAGYLTLQHNPDSHFHRLFASNSYSPNFDSYFHPSNHHPQIWEIIVNTNAKSESSRMIMARIFDLQLDSRFGGLPRQILLVPEPVDFQSTTDYKRHDSPARKEQRSVTPPRDAEGEFPVNYQI
ncbi:hypothetical protein PMAYCL1PPCAC_16350, partial [Pristionchus mayeri]